MKNIILLASIPLENGKHRLSINMDTEQSPFAMSFEFLLSKQELEQLRYSIDYALEIKEEKDSAA